MGDDTNPKDLVGDKKAPLWLVPPAFVAQTSMALRDGAAKYGPYNWREKAVRSTVYYSALMRHMSSWLDGEDYSEDAGVHHLAHAAACLAILLDAQATGNLIDDRPFAGGAPKLLTELAEFIAARKVLLDGKGSSGVVSQSSTVTDYHPIHGALVHVAQKEKQNGRKS